MVLRVHHQCQHPVLLPLDLLRLLTFSWDQDNQVLWVSLVTWVDLLDYQVNPETFNSNNLLDLTMLVLSVQTAQLPQPLTPVSRLD
jgi:hypothetical protein